MFDAGIGSENVEERISIITKPGILPSDLIPSQLLPDTCCPIGRCRGSWAFHLPPFQSS